MAHMFVDLQATPDAKIQSPALMAVLNRIAVGADMSELVSIVCRVCTPSSSYLANIHVLQLLQ
jgi:hypothetical protein